MRAADGDGPAGGVDGGRLRRAAGCPGDGGGVGGGEVGRVGVEEGAQADLGQVRPHGGRDRGTDRELPLGQGERAVDITYGVVGQLVLVVAQQARDRIGAGRAGGRGGGAVGGGEGVAVFQAGDHARLCGRRAAGRHGAVGTGHCQRCLCHGERAGGDAHRIVSQQAGAAGGDTVDCIAAHTRGGRVAGAAVGDLQVLAVDARGQRGRQGRAEVGRRAIDLAGAAQGQGDGRLADCIAGCGGAGAEEALGVKIALQRVRAGVQAGDGEGGYTVGQGGREGRAGINREADGARRRACGGRDGESDDGAGAIADRRAGEAHAGGADFVDGHGGRGQAAEVVGTAAERCRGVVCADFGRGRAKLVADGGRAEVLAGHARGMHREAGRAT